MACGTRGRLGRKTSNSRVATAVGDLVRPADQVTVVVAAVGSRRCSEPGGGRALGTGRSTGFLGVGREHWENLWRQAGQSTHHHGGVRITSMVVVVLNTRQQIAFRAWSCVAEALICHRDGIIAGFRTWESSFFTIVILFAFDGKSVDKPAMDERAFSFRRPRLYRRLQ